MANGRSKQASKNTGIKEHRHTLSPRSAEQRATHADVQSLGVCNPAVHQPGCVQSCCASAGTKFDSTLNPHAPQVLLSPACTSHLPYHSERMP